MMNTSHPVEGLRGTPALLCGNVYPSLFGRNEIVTWDAESRARYTVPYADRPVEFKQRANEALKAKNAAKAIADGREPGRVGRPPRLTPEEKEASRIAQNKKRSARSLAKRTAKRAARAIAEGRTPGVAGQPRILSDEERLQKRRESALICKWAKIDVVREADNASRKARVAARAVAEGRVPGILGRLASFSAEELARYMVSWPDRTDVFHHRLQTNNSRAKRMGASGTVTLAELREICEEQKAHCAFCGKPFGEETPEIDHWVALAIGGTNTADNIKLLHMLCNRTKGAKHPSVFGLPLRAALTCDPAQVSGKGA